MKIRHIFFGLALLLCGANAFGTVESGKVYRIKSVGTPGRTMALSATNNDAVGPLNDDSDTKQQWLITAADDGSGYYLRNVFSGGYLKSSKETSQKWSVVIAETPDASTMKMNIYERTDHIEIRAVSDNNGYGYAHKDGYHNIVCWTNASTSTNTHWTMEQVPLSDAELDAILQRFRSTADEIAKNDTYQAHLEQLFNDYACTDLKVKTDLASNEHYKALPPTLRAMVDKLASGHWAEVNGSTSWDDIHAEKYRVQLYEPYSEGNAAASLARIQAYTNMNNPTGILGDTGDLIYVMVEDEIPEGATLYISGAIGGDMFNSVNAGQKLKRGLNTLLCSADASHYFVYYTVETVKNGTITEHKVTDYDPIKIHIEGGRINGFFNPIGDDLYTPDTWDDFKYTTERASHQMFDLVGKYVILHFHLEDTPSHPTDAVKQFGVKNALDESKNPGKHKYNPVEIIKDWDNMCFSERILMGIQSAADVESEYNRGMYSDIVGKGYAVGAYRADPGFYFSDYFNNRMMGISQQGDLYMNATSWRTAYNVSTISYVLTEFYDDGLWGPAHEYGHMNQGPINIAGTTEVSNNTFSNVARYYSAEYNGSRNDMPKAELDAFYDGKCFIQYGGGNTTRMFWQLWCYYHGTKHNTKFYPRLYELLRKNPLTKVTRGNGIHNERYDMLHFAKMCCIAAGEDLTNFFTAWGFFVPFENMTIDDYSTYDARLTPEDIAAVKEEIAAFEFEPNEAIMFIDDRVGLNPNAGDLGSFADFTEGKANAGGDFSFTIDGTTINVVCDGEDGVGYIIFDEDGNLLGFSNSHSFELTPETAQALLSGKATVEAVGADNSRAQVTNTILDGSIEDKVGILSDILERVKTLLQYTDDSNKHVGYYIAERCTDLDDLREQAETILESPDSDALTTIIKTLTEEYLAVTGDETTRVTVQPGASYVIKNRAYEFNLAADNDKLISSAVDSKGTPFDAQWLFEELDGGKYALQNYSTGEYINSVSSNNTNIPMNSVAAAYALVPMDAAPGLFALTADNNSSHSIHMASGKNIVIWNTGAAATHWTITMVNTEEYLKLRQDMADLIEKAEGKLAEAGTTAYHEHTDVALTDDCFYSNAPYTAGNNGDTFRSWSVLTDGDVNTYFHSDYSGADSRDGLDHYIRIKAPGDDTFRNVVFSYTTRNSATAQATKIQAYRIEASTNMTDWTTAYISQGTLNTGAAQVNTTPQFLVDEGTKYIRFMVTNAPGKQGGHSFFAISQLNVKNSDNGADCTPDEKFENLTSGDMEDVAKNLVESKISHASYATSDEDLQSRYDALNDSYMNLVSKMEGESGIVGIQTLDSSDAEYYNLQGIRVENPSNGIYIRRTAAGASKVLVTE